MADQPSVVMPRWFQEVCCEHKRESIHESRAHWDSLGLLIQLGAVPEGALPRALAAAVD